MTIRQALGQAKGQAKDQAKGDDSERFMLFSNKLVRKLV